MQTGIGGQRADEFEGSVAAQHEAQTDQNGNRAVIQFRRNSQFRMMFQVRRQDDPAGSGTQAIEQLPHSEAIVACRQAVAIPVPLREHTRGTIMVGLGYLMTEQGCRGSPNIYPPRCINRQIQPRRGRSIVGRTGHNISTCRLRRFVFRFKQHAVQQRQKIPSELQGRIALDRGRDRGAIEFGDDVNLVHRRAVPRRWVSASVARAMCHRPKSSRRCGCGASPACLLSEIAS